MYPGSDWNATDVSLVLEMFKVIGHMGDGLESVLFGFLASLLPKGNTLSEKLNSHAKTGYFYQQAIKSGHGSFQKLRVIEIQTCRNGCSAFIGPNHQSEMCPICEENNDESMNEIIYYFPVVDRIRKIIKSDLRKFLNFPNIRRPSADNFFEDIYDGENYKWFENQMNQER